MSVMVRSGFALLSFIAVCATSALAAPAASVPDAGIARCTPTDIRADGIPGSFLIDTTGFVNVPADVNLYVWYDSDAMPGPTFGGAMPHNAPATKVTDDIALYATNLVVGKTYDVECWGAWWDANGDEHYTATKTHTSFTYTGN